MICILCVFFKNIFRMIYQVLEKKVVLSNPLLTSLTYFCISLKKKKIRTEEVINRICYVISLCNFLLKNCV